MTHGPTFPEVIFSLPLPLFLLAIAVMSGMILGAMFSVAKIIQAIM
jgi:hypothetical protein